METAFNKDGCLQLPQVLMLFARAAETPPQVADHLQACCWCADHVQPVIEKTGHGRGMADCPCDLPDDVRRRAEAIFFDIASGNAQDVQARLQEAWALLRQGGSELWRHMLDFVKFPAGLLGDMPRALPHLLALRRLLITDADYPVRTQFAADDDADDTAEFAAKFNNWNCRVIYHGAQKDTELLPEVPLADAPILNVYPLRGTSDDFDEPDKITAAPGPGPDGCVVYRLSGEYCQIVQVPGSFGAIKIFTMDWIKKRYR